MSRSAQFAVAASAVVVAVCAVVLTAKVLWFSGLPVEARQEMTFNSAELAKRVQRVLGDRGELPGISSGMSCPEHVVIRSGNAFGCSVVHDDKVKTVRIVVTDAEAGTIQVGKLEG
ncbi:DUF4333 domain-containing protein [Lentzea sp. NBRC 102530]|uniref:DUF4333 domain-containing protein n=1 Tax=Lentzea sp. NBRC 102530 TaxID=3032201 RepID=UPI0024A0C791|nr:DUF4333 domain-containing protein [Lentzea sp. NBRC 102530]GLY52772.1 hypothetical protein Lesp01_64280 [Lentzea sp. NBRC 102530]